MLTGNTKGELVFSDARTSRLVGAVCSEDEDIVGVVGWSHAASSRDSCDEIEACVLTAPRFVGQSSTLSLWKATRDCAQAFQRVAVGVLPGCASPIAAFRWGKTTTVIVSAFSDGCPSASVYRCSDNDIAEVVDVETDAGLSAVLRHTTRSPLTALVFPSVGSAVAGYLDGTVVEFSMKTGATVWSTRVSGISADLCVVSVESAQFLCVADAISSVAVIGPLGLSEPWRGVVAEQVSFEFFLPSSERGSMHSVDPTAMYSSSLPPNLVKLNTTSSSGMGESLRNGLLGLAPANMDEPSEFTEAAISDGPISLFACDVDGDGREELLIGTSTGHCAVVKVRLQGSEGTTPWCLAQVERTVYFGSQVMALVALADGDDVGVVFGVGPTLFSAWSLPRAVPT